MSPKISVLMPAYNTENYIVDAIESILNQTFTDFEFIIVDDCSTDSTLSILKQYENKDSRIKVLENPKNLGIAGNRNKLKKIAKGKYIIWQDSDDISIKDRLENQYKYMEANTDVGISGGSLLFFNSKKELHTRKYSLVDSEIRKNIFKFSPVAQPGAIIRRDILDEMGDYDLNYPPAEDLDMSFRIGRKYKFGNIPNTVIRYRENDNSATFTRLKTIELKTISIRLRYADGIHYKMNILNHLYNILQYISIFLIPTKLKIFLFNLMRNS